MLGKKKIRIKRSSFLYRLMAGIIDLFIWLFLWFQLHMILVDTPEISAYLINLPDKLFLFVFYLYLVAMEASIGATIGKLIFSLQVRDKNLKRITFARTIVRNLTKLVAVLPFFLGYITVIFRKDKMALHDLISDSLVVRLEKK